MAEAVKVAQVDDVEPGQTLRIDAETAGTEDNVCLVRTDDGEFRAIDDTCTHAMAWLSEGWVEGETVECPVHAAAFCLKTGAALTPPATEPVRVHQVEVRDGAVWLTPGDYRAGVSDV